LHHPCQKNFFPFRSNAELRPDDSAISAGTEGVLMLLGNLDRGVAGEPEHFECAVSYGHIQPKRIPDNMNNRKCTFLLDGSIPL
jgi:hypothetical protein